jgi:hypothetical protein
LAEDIGRRSVIHAILRFLSWFVIWLQSSETCLSTIFGTPGDRWAGGRTACTKELPGQAHGVAHRTFPCGTELLLHNPRTRKTARAVVLDRGPFGAMHKGKWLVKIRRRDPGVWRGCLDLTPSLARALGHNGKELVTFWRITRPSDGP